MSPNFLPPYCPNVTCQHHIPKRRVVFYYRHGKFERSGTTAKRKTKHRSQQRFQCKQCGRSFCESTFLLRYRNKIHNPRLNYHIFQTLMLGASNRQIGRYLKMSADGVRKRILRMSQWAFLIHREKLMSLTQISETLTYDGLENFAGSQFEPNNINQVVGRDSLFIYDFSFAPLNRKGKMSDRQKIKKAQLEKTLGRFPQDAVRRSTTDLLRRVVGLNKDPSCSVRICTDEHYQYKKSISIDLSDLPIEHITISSRATRNFQNILFPVNHSDLVIRSILGCFSRETISFSKTSAAMCQKFILYAVFKNYMQPQYTKPHTSRPKANEQTPAQSLGIENKRLRFNEFFNLKKTTHQVEVPWDWFLFLQSRSPYPRTHPSKQ